MTSKADQVADALTDYETEVLVYYFSKEFQKWLPGWVTDVHPDGAFVRYHRRRPVAFVNKRIYHARLRRRYEGAEEADIDDYYKS